MKVIARSRVGWNAAPAASGIGEQEQGRGDHAERVALLDLLDEQLRPRLGRRGLLDHGDDPGDHGVGRGPARPRTRSAPVPLLVPANTSSPGFLAAGSGSPVIVAWSTSLEPDSTCPSAAMRSPGRTRITSPIRRLAASTACSPPASSSRVACSGARSSRPRTAWAVRWVATASRAPEVAKMTISRPPSRTCPTAAAPTAARTISRSTSRVLRAQRPQPGQPRLPAAGRVAGQEERPRHRARGVRETGGQPGREQRGGQRRPPHLGQRPQPGPPGRRARRAPPRRWRRWSPAGSRARRLLRAERRDQLTIPDNMKTCSCVPWCYAACMGHEA